MTEVHEAAANGDSAQIDTLMNTGRYDANAKDQEWHDRTPMHWAAIKGGFFFCYVLFLFYCVFCFVLFCFLFMHAQHLNQNKKFV